MLNHSKTAAKVRYLPNDLQVMSAGDHVLCAVTGQPIDLDALCYWNVERQEAYAGPQEALQRYLELRQSGK